MKRKTWKQQPSLKGRKGIVRECNSNIDHYLKVGQEVEILIHHRKKCSATVSGFMVKPFNEDVKQLREISIVDLELFASKEEQVRERFIHASVRWVPYMDGSGDWFVFAGKTIKTISLGKGATVIEAWSDAYLNLKS